MGGYGSGRPGRRPKVESGIALSIDYMASRNLLSPGTSGGMNWSRNGERFASIGFSVDSSGLVMTLDYTKGSEEEAMRLNYPVSLIKTPAHFGGERTWFRCPIVGCTSGKLSKLYLPSGAVYFGCRKCYKLTYTSCNESHRWDALYARLGRDMGVCPRAVKELLGKV